MNTTTTTHKPTEIQQPVLYRCTDKSTHEVFYLVKSDSQADTWYAVRWNAQATAWQCSCPATKPCKHERAVQEVLKLRRQRIAAQMGGNVPAIVATIQAEEDKRVSQVQVEPRLSREEYVKEFSIY